MQSNNMEGIHAKLYLHGGRGCVKEIRRLHVSRSLSWEGLREKVREIFGMEGDVDLSYQDPEGDQVILSCEGEWQECIHLNTDAQQPHLRINVQPKKRKCGRSTSPTTTTTRRHGGCPHHHNHHQTRQAESDHENENENENATKKDGCGQADRNGNHEWNRHWWTELARAYTIGGDGSQQQHHVTEGLEEVSATVCGLVNRFLGEVGQVSEWLQPALNRTMDEVDVNVRAFGHCLHRRGLWLMKQKEYTAACELFQNAAQVQPRRAASHLYNAACCQALLNQTEEAINTLQQAVAEGYCNLRHMLADEDLSSLRELRGFEEIVQGMVERMEARFGGEGGEEGGWKGRWWRRKHQMAAAQHQHQHQHQRQRHQQPQPTPQEEEASREPSSVGERNDIVSADDETATATATATGGGGGEESSVVAAEAEAEVPHAQPPSVQPKAEEEPEPKPEEMEEEQPTPLSRAVEEEEEEDAHPSSGVKASADMALRFEAELVSLCGMGFMDVDRNLCALVESEGRLAEAVERLLA